jgi:hypothetical protein
MAVRVNQSVVEIVTLAIPNVRVNQSVIELITFPVPPSIGCGNPPVANLGASYTHAFPAAGGVAPYTFSIASGMLPPGTQLNTTTGVVSGTPTLVGNFAFTIQVVDTQLSSAAASCAIVVQAPLTQPISGGGPPAILCPRPINLYDICADDAVRKLKRIHFPQACNIPECSLPWDEDYHALPAGAVPFLVQGSILTPAPSAGDVLVCQGRVPYGYDALLMAIYQQYVGPGFAQGSGDIVWRIRRNQVWLKTLGNMPYAMGSPRNAVPLTQGELMFSGTQFFHFVNVPNLSGAIQIGSSRILCGMLGFYWPRG